MTDLKTIISESTLKSNANLAILYIVGTNADRQPIRSVTKSANWEGDGWYRMMAPAGTVMPESSPGAGHCGTKLAGWLNASHPSVPGEKVQGKHQEIEIKRRDLRRQN